jgi:hypothetical protein
MPIRQRVSFGIGIVIRPAAIILTVVFTLTVVFAVFSGLPARAAAPVYTPETVAHGGTIAGVITYAGTPPAPERLEITKDLDICGISPQYDQSLLVGKSGGVANAVVALTDISRGAPLVPMHAVEFDQIGCEYRPRVLAFPAGSTVQIVNSDGILHNVHTQSTINPPINVAQPGFKRVIEVTVASPELISVSCDVHNWMQGWWYVAANPYYALTGADGRYELNNVPPGTYTLRVWQERLGTVNKKVTVAPDGKVTADFALGPLK